VTEWLRKAIAPLIAGVHWERTHRTEQTAPVTRVDVEAAFMIVIPMLDLPADVSGRSRLAVQLNGNEAKQRLAGVMVEVDKGRIGNCTSRLEGEPAASGIGTATAWIRAVTDPDPDRLNIDGDRRLAKDWTSCNLQGKPEGLRGRPVDFTTVLPLRHSSG